MKVQDTKFFKAYIQMADDGDRYGWHERNGGNFTYWMTEVDVKQVSDHLNMEGSWHAIGTTVKELANEFFVISATGGYFHHMKTKPEHTAGIIQINETGEQYRMCWGFQGDGRPTSELPTHLMNMEARLTISKGKDRVIYHCHCPHMITLSFLLPLKSEIITRELWEMMSECPIIFPEGIGVVEWMVPGGRDIAIVSSQLMKQHRAILWAHHGMFCCGKDFDETFGLMHTIEKSAQMWIMVHACGSGKRQTIPVEGFRKLAKAFHVTLDERYLYEKEPVL